MDAPTPRPPLALAELTDAGWRVRLPAAPAQAAAALDEEARRAEAWARPWRQLSVAPAVTGAEVRVLSHLELLLASAAAGRQIAGAVAEPGGSLRESVTGILRSIRSPSLIETWGGDSCRGRSRLSLVAVDTVWPAGRDPVWEAIHLRVVGMVVARIRADLEIVADLVGAAGRAAATAGALVEPVADALWRRAGPYAADPSAR